MRRRTSGINDDDATDSSADSEENHIQAAHPDDDARGTNKLLPLFAVSNTEDPFQQLLTHLMQGKLWWARCLTIFFAATLTYTFKNASTPNKHNVQIAIMTVITLVGATPLSSQIIPVAIGAFVGGHNIIGSTGLMEDNTEIHPINYAWLLLLSVVVGLCFQVFLDQKILDGYAGRLGSTTFLGMNIVMLTIYGPLGVVDWDRYYYGFNHIIHMAEEDSALDLSSAWSWTEETELAIGYVLAVTWLGWVSGVTRILHNDYIQRWNQQQQQHDDEATPRPTTSPPPAPLNNVTIPVLWALLSMLIINATEYKHASGLYNGFAVGSYVGMASLQKIPSISKFVVVSLLAALWGLVLTPVFVGFAGKSGFTAMLGHVTYVRMDAVMEGILGCRSSRRRRQQLVIEGVVEEGEMDPERLHQHQEEQSLVDKEDDHHSDKEDRWTLKPELNVSRKYIKPKEPFLTKQQRRQQQRMKSLQKQQERKETVINDSVSNAPKLHHRAWSAVPGDDPWKHPMEDPNQPSAERQNVV